MQPPPYPDDSRQPVPSRKRGRLLVATLCLGWASGAAADPMAQVRALIDDAACSNDAQCRTVAIGQKDCGGPEAWLAWSTRRTDEKALKAAVAAYEAARANEPTPPDGRRSNCLFVADPGAACLPAASGRACQLRRAGSRSAP